MINIFDLILIILGFISSFCLFYRYPRIEKIDIKNNVKASIIIPCRNEDDKINLIIEDLINQNNMIHEVIVVNDQSTDNSENIIKKYPVKLINVTNKDASYYGKSYALEYGSSFSNNEILIFIDADVRLHKDAINTLISLHLSKNKTISIQPYHEIKNLYESLSLPFNLIQLSANHTTSFKGTALGLYGPIIIISKETYDLIGKHSKVKDSIIEDVSLGIELTKKNLEFENYIGNHLYKIRMYPNGIKSLFQGWLKNISFGASKTNLLTFIMVFLFIASHLASAFLYINTLISFTVESFLLSISIYYLWSLRLFYISKKIGNFNLFTVLIHPLLFIGFTFIFFISLVKKLLKIPFIWKNRKVN